MTDSQFLTLMGTWLGDHVAIVTAWIVLVLFTTVTGLGIRLAISQAVEHFDKHLVSMQETLVSMQKAALDATYQHGLADGRLEGASAVEHVARDVAIVAAQAAAAGRVAATGLSDPMKGSC